jgi:cellulose synthase/poly-beta-1,6-N-acetylglucosamine synthase-like glycosyltransferase
VSDTGWATWAFWIAVAGVFYPYVGYPLVLAALGRLVGRPRPRLSERLPTVSMIIPVHNEAIRLEGKIGNTKALDYPADRLEVLFVSDGSTDGTVDLIKAHLGPGMALVELPVRGGKAAALNAGLARAAGDIVVFTDASIALEPRSLRALVQPFGDPRVGCVSGEDRIADGGGEGLYGRYELFLRRLESNVHSIVGASGSFYAQRRELCSTFTEGMAPDFLSVLRTVQQGYRALSEPGAVGEMSSLKDPRQEFDRKVRTLLRGMTALFAYKPLLNPFRHGLFAFALWSHKVLRWTVPFFLVAALLAPLARLDRPFYVLVFWVQVAFYAMAAIALAEWGDLHRTLPGRIVLYFSSVNAAILTAWYRYWLGVRQELWTPTHR